MVCGVWQRVVEPRVGLMVVVAATTCPLTWWYPCVQRVVGNQQNVCSPCYTTVEQNARRIPNQNRPVGGGGVGHGLCKRSRRPACVGWCVYASCNNQPNVVNGAGHGDGQAGPASVLSGLPNGLVTVISLVTAAGGRTSSGAARSAEW